MKHIAVYIRKSREDKSKKNHSLKEQRLLGEEFCDSNGFKPVYYDDGIISGTIEDRPEFQKMISDIKSNKLQGVFIWNTDRLSRDVGSFETLAKAMRYSNTLLYDNGVTVDLNDHNQSMMYTMKSAIDEHYAKVTRSKIIQRLNRNFRTGKAHGRDTYGYTKDADNYIIIDNEEGDIVREIYDKSLKGKTPFKIAEYLNSKNIPTKYNKLGGTLTIKNKFTGKSITKKKESVKWAESTVRKILTNEVYTGKRTVKHRDKTNIYEVPVIIESDLFNKVNKKFSKNNSGKNVEYKYLLNGLLECARCGRNYYGRVNKSNVDNYYMCSSKRYKNKNCKNKSINRPKLDSFIWEVLTSSSLIKKIEAFIEKDINKDKIEQVKRELETLAKEIDAITLKKNKAIQMALNGLVTDDDIKSTVSSLNLKMNSLKDKLDNKREELEYFSNSNNDLRMMKQELMNVRKDIPDFIKEKALQDLIDENTSLQFPNKGLPFDVKKKLLNKYIKRIYIESDKCNLYEVKIVFKSLNPVVYVINRSFGMIRTVNYNKIDVRGEYNNITFKNQMLDRVNNYEPKMR